MSVLTQEEFLKRIGSLVGNTDDGISLLEDASDTFKHITEASDVQKLQAENTSLKADNERLRTSYRERFMSGEVTTPQGAKDDQREDVKEDDAEKISFADLFKERES